MSTHDKTLDYDLSTLDKVTQPTIGNLLKAQNQIATILADYPCAAAASGAYGHAFLIYSAAVWLTKDGITTPVIIDKPPPFTGTSFAARYAYEDRIKQHTEMNKHQKGTIRMIKYIFPEPVFLDLCDDQGQLVGKTPQEIMKHLQDSFCDDEEMEEEILRQQNIMGVKYDPSMLIQVYFKALQDARSILVSLKETVDDKVLIRQGIDQFNKHMDLNDAVDEWKKKATNTKTWKAFQTHFFHRPANHRHATQAPGHLEATENANGIPTTMTYPMDNDPNADTPTATPTASPAAMTFPPNTTAKPANGKKKDTRMMRPFETKWEDLSAISSTTKTNDGVGGTTNSMPL